MISKTMKYEEIFRSVKAASQGLALVHERTKSRILCEIADAILERKDRLLAANAEDLWSMDRRDPLYDRLLLTESRLADIARDMRRVAELPSPSGGVIEARTLPNGLRLRRVSVPFGVVGVIYEARPNVTFDVFSLCFKTGNACILKGGSNAARSNEAIVRLIHGVLAGWPECRPSVVELLSPTHEAAEALLSAVGYVDLCIPRGGRGLIDFVRSKAKVPVIETGAGVVHAYFDEHGDTAMGKMLQYGEEGSKEFTKTFLLKPEHARAHDEHARQRPQAQPLVRGARTARGHEPRALVRRLVLPARRQPHTLRNRHRHLGTHVCPRAPLYALVRWRPWSFRPRGNGQHRNRHHRDARDHHLLRRAVDTLKRRESERA